MVMLILLAPALLQMLLVVWLHIAVLLRLLLCTLL
jgi:hypothetical protein